MTYFYTYKILPKLKSLGSIMRSGVEPIAWTIFLSILVFSALSSANNLSETRKESQRVIDEFPWPYNLYVKVNLKVGGTGVIIGNKINDGEANYLIQTHADQSYYDCNWIHYKMIEGLAND